MWSVRHHKILPPEIQKFVMASNFGYIFDSHIYGTGDQKIFFFGKWFFSDKSNIIPKNGENLIWSVYKSSNFAWFLQTVALSLALIGYCYACFLWETTDEFCLNFKVPMCNLKY